VRIAQAILESQRADSLLGQPRLRKRDALELGVVMSCDSRYDADTVIRAGIVAESVLLVSALALVNFSVTSTS
jgi:hypothetical protein